MRPVVSICIPTYNGERYLKECLDSVRSQSFSDFEVLIVDDQSSDKTLEIAQDYANQDERVKVISNPVNLGLVHNWNRCIELAQGDWIKFVFQDDLIERQCLERMLSLSKDKSLITCCSRKFIFDDKVSDSVRQYYYSLPSLKSLFPDSNLVSASVFCQEAIKQIGLNIIGEPTCVILRRSMFYKFGLFNSDLVQLCDWEFWARVISNVGFTYVDEPLATFRIHGGSTSSMNADKRWYRKDILDPLLIAHDFALHPKYAKLRSFTLEQSSPIDIEKVLSWLAYKAKITAYKSLLNSRNSNQSLFKEWEEIVKLYPSLAIFSNQNYFKHSIKYWLPRLTLNK